MHNDATARENFATHNERCRGQRTGHLDQASATHNERRSVCGQLPEPMPGIINMPHHHKRPAFAFLHVPFANKQYGTAKSWGFGA
jgi:hypothetical protein